MNAPLRFASCDTSKLDRLWSLWDMIERYGHLVFAAINSLAMTERLCAGDLTPPDSVYDPVPDATAAAIDAVRRLAILADWDGLEPAVARLESRVGYLDRSLLGHEVQALRLRIQDDLQHEFFFHLSQADVPLYRGAEPFGELVSRKFPKAIEDIAEGAKCLALQRSTAAVFHLMRVMELALRALATKLKVSAIDPEAESWNKITDHVNRAVNALPAKTAPEQARKAKFGAVLAHLNSVRIAWRNEVMHPKQSYTREEAHAIFAAVRAFMIDLAALK
jgi:hypothetical protein